MTTDPRIGHWVVALIVLSHAGTVRAQSPAARPNLADRDDETVIRIKTAPPSASEMFRLETEKQFRDRLRKETEAVPGTVRIPEYKESVSMPLDRVRGWTHRIEWAEPDRLCFGRLFFSPRADERYGRNFGPIQPFVSTGYFYFDLAKMPAEAFRPCAFMQWDDHRDLWDSPLPRR